MATVDILYVILAVCVVVITVTLVWLSNELIGLIRSIKRSSSDVETVTKEIREKVLLVSEALDRAGTAASNIIGLVEDATESIKAKRDQLVNSIGLITGVGEYARRKKDKSSSADAGEKEKKSEENEEVEESSPQDSEEENEEKVETSEPKEESRKDPKPKSKK
jgi:hypothetical protein